MEIDITKFFNEEDGYQFSARTWRNAVKEGETSPLLKTEEELQALRDYVKDFGAWEEEEIAAWSPAEVNGLFIQLISGDMREIESLCTNDDGSIDWEEYERLAEKGTIGGNLYRGDDGRIYYNLMH